jgi:hypothetical protein
MVMGCLLVDFVADFVLWRPTPFDILFNINISSFFGFAAASSGYYSGERFPSCLSRSWLCSGFAFCIRISNNNHFGTQISEMVKWSKYMQQQKTPRTQTQQTRRTSKLRRATPTRHRQGLPTCHTRERQANPSQQLAKAELILYSTSI